MPNAIQVTIGLIMLTAAANVQICVFKRRVADFLFMETLKIPIDIVTGRKHHLLPVRKDGRVILMTFMKPYLQITVGMTMVKY